LVDTKPDMREIEIENLDYSPEAEKPDGIIDFEKKVLPPGINP